MSPQMIAIGISSGVWLRPQADGAMMSSAS
jgi:hypothetical protein